MTHQNLGGDSGVSEGWQKVLNQSWPAPAVAKVLRDVDSDRQVEVMARVMFEEDGEQWLPGLATRWSGQHVCVAMSDPRLQVAYNWLAASDVRRR